MANKFDEGFAHGLANVGVWGQDIGQREDGKQDAYAYYIQCLKGHVLTPESRQPFVPDAGQKLLHVGVCHKLQARDHRESKSRMILFG